MVRQLLPWRCAIVFLCVLGCGASVSGATNFVTAIRVGLNFYFSPTNFTIPVGDTVVWSLLNNGQAIHSLTPYPTNTTEPFCGRGTNLIASCTVTFTSPGYFPYFCEPHPSMTGSVRVVSFPIVMITNLPNNSVVRTNTDIKLLATASDLDGSVTNVQFLRNSISFATNIAPPYAATWSNAVPGVNHIFHARATDNSGNVTLSDSITVRAVPPPTLTVTNTTNGTLRFNFSTVLNVSYVVEGAVTLTNFSPIVTNVGNGNPQQFTQSNPAPAQKFFRLRLQ